MKFFDDMSGEQKMFTSAWAIVGLVCVVALLSIASCGKSEWKFEHDRKMSLIEKNCVAKPVVGGVRNKTVVGETYHVAE